MEHGINFDKLEEQDFTKYLSYMTRHYALEQKKELTQREQKEYQRLNQAMKNIKQSHIKSFRKSSWSFSMASDEVKGSDLKEIKQIFQRGQQKAQSFIKMLSLTTIRILKKWACTIPKQIP